MACVSLCLCWGISGDEIRSWSATPTARLVDIVGDEIAEISGSGVVRLMFEGEMLPEDLRLEISTLGVKDVLLTAVKTKEHRFGRRFIPYVSVNGHAVRCEELSVTVVFDPWVPERLKHVIAVMAQTWECEFGKQLLEILRADVKPQVLRRRMERFNAPSDGQWCHHEAYLVFAFDNKGTVVVRMEKAHFIVDDDPTPDKIAQVRSQVKRLFLERVFSK